MNALFGHPMQHDDKVKTKKKYIFYADDNLCIKSS